MGVASGKLIDQKLGNNFSFQFLFPTFCLSCGSIFEPALELFSLSKRYPLSLCRKSVIPLLYIGKMHACSASENSNEVGEVPKAAMCFAEFASAE